MPIDFNDGDGIQALDQNEHSERWQYSVKSGVSVSPGTNDLTVQCSSGGVIFDGTSVSVGAQDNVSLAAADDTQPRKDVVYVDANGTLQVATGTPEAAVPSGETRFQTQRPAPNDLSGTDAVVVAEVWVAAGVSDIAAADVRDRRQFADLATRSLDTDELYNDSAEVQSRLDGQIVPVADGLGPKDAFDTSSKSALNDAVQAVGDAGGGKVLLPAVNQISDQTTVDARTNVTVKGVGAEPTTVGFQTGEDGLDMDGETGDVQGFHVIGVRLDGGGFGGGETGIAFRGSGLRDSVLHRVRFQNWNNAIWDVGNAYQNTWGHVLADFSENVNADAMFDFGGDLGLSIQGLAVYPKGQETGTNSPVAKFSNSMVDIGYMNLGGDLAEAVIHEETTAGRGIRIGSINWEPDSSVTEDCVVKVVDNDTPLVIGSGAVSTGEVTNFYQIQGTANVQMGRVAAGTQGFGGTITGSPVSVEGDLNGPCYYWGVSGDIDNNAGQGLSHPVSCLGDLTTVT